MTMQIVPPPNASLYQAWINRAAGQGWVTFRLRGKSRYAGALLACRQGARVRLVREGGRFALEFTTRFALEMPL